MGNLLSKGEELKAKLFSRFFTEAVHDDVQHPEDDDDEFVVIGEDGQIITLSPQIAQMEEKVTGKEGPPEETPKLGKLASKISIGVPEELTGSQLPKPKSSVMSMDRSPLAEEVFLLPTFPRADLKELRVKTIGQGAFSTVWLAKMKTSTSGKPFAEEDVAIKTLSITQKHQSYEKDLEGFRGEVYILTKLKNQPFIVEIQDFWVDDRGEHNIALELVRAGNLKSILKKKKFFSEKQTKFLAAQLVLALESLRAHSVVYR